MLYQVTSFYLLFLLHSLVNSASTTISHSYPSLYVCDEQESFALLEFKHTFSLDESASYMCQDYGQIFYPRTQTWNESRDCCTWDGVECDEDGAGHVIGLDVSCSELSGTIHPNSSLFTLSYLQRLNLAHNHFNFSPISSLFGRLQNLRFLNLSSSSLSGNMPLEISQLSKLVSLDLSSNDQLRISSAVWNKLVHNLTNIRDLKLSQVDLSDITPISLTNLSLSLAFLSLDSCELSGNFPDHVFSRPNLRMLRVSANNELNGHLPKSNWSKSLEILDLRATNFSGDIPNTIGEVKFLKYLDLGYCNFNGPIPEAIGNLTQLTTFILLENELNGKIPSTIANLDQLILFAVENNQLTGTIPDIWTNLQKLIGLDFGDNSFTGQLPNSIFNLTQLSYLRVSNNFLSGSLPTHIPPPGLSNLVTLKLADNSLNNTIPSWLFASPRLVDLDLSNNQFIGFIKDFKSNSLEHLDLSGNNLQGAISESIYRQVNLTSLTLGSNNFSGILNLDMLLKIETLSELNTSKNNQLSIYSTNDSNSSSLSLYSIAMASCKLSEFPYLLRNLKNLQFLDLSNNQIQGEVPNWLSELGGLRYLNISHNLLSAGIEVLSLTNLEDIFLDFNLFKVPIPTLPLSAQFFTASNNQFYGHIHPSICQATSLSILNLSNNSLSGTIPPCLVNITSLSVLDLKRNSFSGSIPTIFPKGSQLRNFDLNGNQIEGELPESLLHCENLQVLDVGNNMIRGTFPHWLEAFSSLRVLILRSNRFNGPINNSMTTYSFPALQIMDLSHNYFSGLLPSTLFQNLKAMKAENQRQLLNFSNRASVYYEDSVVLTMKGNDWRVVNRVLFILSAIDFSNNNFTGEIPIQIGTLASLNVLNLSHNNLKGQIHPSFGRMINLESLDLSSNQLLGKIPYQLAAGLTFLSSFNVSHNHLSGLIPQGKQFDTFDNSSYSGNSGLCGRPLSRKCSEERSPSVVEEGSSSKDEVIWWKAGVTGYVCGVVCGISVGYIVLQTGRPVRIAAIVERKMQRSRRNVGGRRE